MIITDKFIFIHDPKTGGSFVSSVLFQMYGVKWNTLNILKLGLFSKIKQQTSLGLFIQTNKKHFGCQYIPTEYLGKNILATVRNPYDWYVSQYEFGWWKKKQMSKYYKNIESFEKKYAHFPNLSFNEFIQISNEVFDTNFNCSYDIWSQYGWRTRSFLNYYFKNPTEGAIKLQDSEYIISQKYKSDLFDNLYFIQTKHLNENLHDFLLKMDYTSADIDFILKKEKVLPLGKGRTKEQIWEQYFTPELKATIRQKDAFLFDIFPEFDI